VIVVVAVVVVVLVVAVVVVVVVLVVAVVLVLVLVVAVVVVVVVVLVVAVVVVVVVQHLAVARAFLLSSLETLHLAALATHVVTRPPTTPQRCSFADHVMRLCLLRSNRRLVGGRVFNSPKSLCHIVQIGVKVKLLLLLCVIG